MGQELKDTAGMRTRISIRRVRRQRLAGNRTNKVEQWKTDLSAHQRQATRPCGPSPRTAAGCVGHAAGAPGAPAGVQIALVSGVPGLTARLRAQDESSAGEPRRTPLPRPQAAPFQRKGRQGVESHGMSPTPPWTGSRLKPLTLANAELPAHPGSLAVNLQAFLLHAQREQAGQRKGSIPAGEASGGVWGGDSPTSRHWALGARQKRSPGSGGGSPDKQLPKPGSVFSCCAPG